MDPDLLIGMRVAGIAAMIGSLIYGLGDVFLLAPKVGATNGAPGLKVDLSGYPAFKRRVELLNGLAVLPWPRIVWGGLLGVFAAPFTLAGVWQVYQGLSQAGARLALPPALLFTAAAVIGPFIHGSFIYLAQNMQMLNAVSEDARPILVEALARQQKVMQIGYGVLFLCIIAASIWYSAAVATGKTAFPIGMALVNPVLATIVWLLVKKALPKRIQNYTEGAGFNIAYLAFFALTTAALW